jgi:imidazolonepropionase-like amidohydrolase
MKTLIENASLIDGLAAEPATGMNLLIEDGTIVEIGPAVAPDGADEIIDAAGKTVMPGMIDAHLHLMGIRAYDPVLASIEDPFLRAARGVADVRKLIEAGFTSVRCAGSNLGVSLNAAVEEGTIPGPRIVASNLAISQTAGHGALGTDFAGPAGVAHGDNAVELEILVKQVGMSPMEAIASATRIAAEALGLEDEIGTLSAGKKADLLIVDGDPSQDVGILKQKAAIELVMKSGRVVVDRR